MTFVIPKSEPLSKRFSMLIGKITGIDVAQDDWRSKLKKWIAQHPETWWSAIWIACEIKGEPGRPEDLAAIENIRADDVFANAKINVAENIFTFGPRTEPSLTSWAEDGPRSVWTRARVKELAGRFASAFYALGLQAGDVVVLNLPDTPEKAAAFLGASWMGLVSVIEPPWMSRKPEFWAEFSPKIILTCDGYRRAGKWVDQSETLQQMGQVTPDNVLVVPIPCAGSRQDVQSLPGIFPWERFNRLGQGGGRTYQYVSYQHPLAHIAQVNSKEFTQINSGPWLLHQLQNWLLSAEIGTGTHILLADTNGQSDWMTAVAALATGSDIVLYDGDSSAMNGQVLWRMIEREQVRIIRLHTDFIKKIRNEKIIPNENHRLGKVELVLVDGTLSASAQDFVKEHCFPNAKMRNI